VTPRVTPYAVWFASGWDGLILHHSKMGCFGLGGLDVAEAEAAYYADQE
jgi:hypothetical protein